MFHGGDFNPFDHGLASESHFLKKNFFIEWCDQVLSLHEAEGSDETELQQFFPFLQMQYYDLVMWARSNQIFIK